MFQELMFLLPLAVLVLGSVYVVKKRLSECPEEFEKDTAQLDSQLSLQDQINKLKKELARVSEELEILKRSSSNMI